MLVSIEMNERQRTIARHALGLPNQHKRSYRNSFVASPGHAEYGTLEELLRMGHITRYGDSVWRLTASGARAALLPGERLNSQDFPAKGAA